MNTASMVRQIYQTFSGKVAPEGFEYSRIGQIYWVNIIQNETNSLISDRIYSGFDCDFSIAVSKAMSEKAEREAFQFGLDSGHPACQADRSDGFAVMPRLNASSIKKARENALDEAIERYAWATWWDNSEVSFEHEQFEIGDLSSKSLGIASDMLRELASNLEILKLHLIKPHISNCPGKELLIFVAELENGVITGGACGPTEERSRTTIRAISELFRHGLVLIQNPERKPKGNNLSFYEQRLFYFASSVGFDKFYERIRIMGSRPVVLPKLAFDVEIPHPKEAEFAAYRCLFENQPPFVGGALDRMCL